MSKEDEVTLRITISDDCHTELTILGMRKAKKMKVADVIREILEKHADRKKETNQIT